MYWPVFAVVLFIGTLVQITAGKFLTFAGGFVRPDFLALLAMFFALYAPRYHAPLVIWIVGFIADLLSLGPPGAFAFSFGLLGLLVLWARDLLYIDHPVSRLILVFSWTFLAQVFTFIIPWLLGRQSFFGFLPFLGLSCRIAIYTAVFTPLYYLMAPRPSWFGLPIPRQRF